MPYIKNNIILNGLNTITGIVFPIITFPYAARILLPEGIGAINFLNAIIGYIILVTSLGIPMYAVKEIAKFRDDKLKRDILTVEMLSLTFALCFIGYIVVWLLALYIPKIHTHATLFYILSLSILFNSIGVNWFYQAVEDFRFITIRAIAVRILSTAALFIFVKHSSDLLIYGIIIVCSTVGNNFINFIHLRKHLDLRAIRLKKLQISRHVKPAIQVFIFNLIVSLYIQLNSIMLGFISGDEAVGYFTAGTKISYIGITLIASIGTVLLPRCSNMINSGDKEGFRTIIDKSLRLTLMLALPITAGLMLLATPITLVFCGSEYSQSITVLCLNAPVIVFISLTNILGIQILYPMDKIKLVVVSVTGGALLNLILNLILIPSHGAAGAAIATLIAEFGVLVIQCLIGRSYYPFKLSEMINLHYITATLIMSTAVFLSTVMIESHILKISVALIVGIAVYATVLLKIKDEMMCDFTNYLKRKINHA